MLKTNLRRYSLLGFLAVFFGSMAVGAIFSQEGNARSEVQQTTKKKWDFTKWSDATVTNLKADAAASKVEGWSDVEKKADAEADAAPTDISKDNCFWAVATPNGDGELSANGVVIDELKGLVFNEAYSTARSLAIAVNYPETSLGSYAGPAYLWLGGGGKQVPCFTIKSVKIGSELTIVAESHKPTDARGVELHQNTFEGDIIGEAFKPTTLATNTWTVTGPEGDETVDVVVYNTSGCHLYSIEAEVVGEAPEEPQPATGFQSFKVDLTNGNLLNSDELVEWQNFAAPIGIAVAADGTVSRVAADAANAVATLNGAWHSNDHGWARFSATVPVDGPVKISMGTCAWGGDVTIKNAEGETIGTFNTNTGECYHSNKEANIVSYIYKGGATTLTIAGGSYTPYFAVEAMPKAEGTAILVDLTNGNLLNSDELVQWQDLAAPIGIAVAADGTVSRVAADDANAVATLNGAWHSNEHGWARFAATVPVKGAVKITLGSCAWGGNVTVKNAEGVEVVPSFSTNTGACYHNDKAANVVSAFYKGGATTLTIQGGNYVPYFAVEPVAEWEIPNDAKITFDLGGVAAEGVVPAEKVVEFGSKYIIPANRTLYVEGKTLTAWTDGSNLYAPGDEITVKEDLALTPVFTANSVSFGDRTAEITAVWDFQQKNGAPLLNNQNNTGIYVTQVTVKGKTIDLKMDFDTNNGGKIANGSWQDWCQMNGGTKLTIPSAKGTVVSMEAYGDITSTSINGKTDYEQGKVISSTIDADAETIDIVIGDGSYYRYVQAVYPAAQEAQPATWKDIYVNLVGSMLKTAERTEGVALEFGVAIADDGTQTRVEANDPSANCVVKGVFHDDSHGWTQSQITVKVDGPVVIGVGNCQYGNQDAYYTDAEGNRVDFQTAKNCWNSNNVAETTTYLKYNGGPTTLTIHGASYCPYFSVEAVKQQWDGEQAVATFVFDQGTEDQKADFGEQAEAFLSSKVLHGETLHIAGTQTHADVKQTAFTSDIANESAPNEGNLIKFIIRPYPGLTFTPSKVSFRATRWGTDSGKLDIAWQNPDGTTVELAKEQSLNRNNSAEPSNFSYVLTDATPGEGECGLVLNLYSVFEGKQMSFGGIVIEGTLSGKKQEIPVLATVTANGVTYDVEKTFEILGDDYVADIELFADEKMINAENPVSVEVKDGQLGTITYDGDDQKTTVTIPVSHNGIDMNWVANFVRKPFYTLTYVDTDSKTVIGTQQVEKDRQVGEFAYGAANATIAEGYAFRGWATAASGSTAVKYTAQSSFQQDTKLYAFSTPIEVASPTARFDYDLTQQNFDPADHEMLTFEGSGYWHDKQHGWAFNKGDKIKLELGGKGYIKMNLCLYSSDGELTLYGPDGTVVGTAQNKAEADGATATIQYDGAQGPGVLTLEIPAVSYIHSISIRNQAEDPFTQLADGNVYVVKRGATDVESGNNLLTMLELANGFSGTDRKVIFLPNGTYDLGETVLTAISRSNLSLVGQSMEGTIIKNAPDRSIEGIGTTATLVNTSTGLYLQDLTLQNALDYYGAVGGGQVGGRAVCLWDKGKQTVSKNVRMLSYQDTYYSNSNSQFYWETSEIHGTVDYLCGGGDVFYEKVKFVNESRAISGKSGSDVIAAPYTDSSSKFGYVFNNCEIENLAASFSLGRSWGGLSKLTWMNTTINQPNEVIDTRFTLNGMNIAAYSFKEYNSVDNEGNVVSPASLVETFTHGNGDYTYDIILSAEQAAEYSYDKVFTTWDPAAQAVQAAAPANVKLDGTSLTWDAAEGVQFWAVLKDGQLAGITTTPEFTVDDVEAEYSVRAANAAGGLGEAAYAPIYATVTVSKVGYATFFDSKNNYMLPEGLEAYVVTTADADALAYAQVKDNIIPAGTAVMLKTQDGKGGEYTLTSTHASVAEIGNVNLLKGSDEATMTFGDNCQYYKLAYGHSGTELANTFGWFWGAADGAAFLIEGHRAWLAIPQNVASTRGYIISADGTTGISTLAGNAADKGAFYNMQGQRVNAPGKGLYIHNNKKIIVK